MTLTDGPRHSNQGGM